MKTHKHQQQNTNKHTKNKKNTNKQKTAQKHTKHKFHKKQRCLAVKNYPQEHVSEIPEAIDKLSEATSDPKTSNKRPYFS